MLPAYSTLDIRRFTRSRRRQELGFQPGSRVSESAPHLGPCVGPACDVACGATSWLCTLHANSTASPQVRRPNASPPQPSAPGGDGQTALVKNHCCRSAAQEHIWNRSESPDPVEHKLRVTQSVCQVRTAQRPSNLGHLQCVATKTLCRLRPHITYQSVSPKTCCRPRPCH